MTQRTANVLYLIAALLTVAAAFISWQLSKK